MKRRIHLMLAFPLLLLGTGFRFDTISTARAGLDFEPSTHNAVEVASLYFRFDPNNAAISEFSIGAEAHSHPELYPSLVIQGRGFSTCNVTDNVLTVMMMGTYNGDPAMIHFVAMDHAKSRQADMIHVEVYGLDGTHLFHGNATVARGDIRVVSQ